ncbi:TolC family protein [Caenimonas terrae]|uniref:TolC family protein n=1 Tax=Caenimonas terrae TaxID=696074 RepID=A0ABW0NHP3_9BURK
MTPRLRLAAVAAVALALSACATPGIDDALRQANAGLGDFTGGKLELSRSPQQDLARSQLSDGLLSAPLAMDGAVQLALANSPALQGLIAERWADLAEAERAGRIANPLFTFDRMRIRGDLELGRLLSIGLLDLLTLPQRRALSRIEGEQARVQLAAGVVDQVGQVRRAWVRAVASQQSLAYAQQVDRAAQAGAELARRMQQVGNFSKLQRARQQAFYADAAAQLASARHAALAAREELVRLLGLDDAQAARLQLPPRLPELPAQPRDPQQLTAAALQQRLDVQLARLKLDAAGKSQGLNLVASLVDVDLGVRHDTVDEAGQRANRNGYELAIRLPLFDLGDAQRAALDAQSLAAANRYQGVARAASSQLRQAYSAYRTAYDLARHYRDEIVPLRKTMQEENVLRYNGMLIGVFELLADTREQIASVMAAIDAQQQFWLADAALSSTLIGSP